MASKTKAHRRLPLNGFSFYFDLNGKNVVDAEKTIKSLGGSVDNFLSNKVKYFIRDRPPNKQLVRKSSRLMSDHAQTRGNRILKKVYASSSEPKDITPLDRAKRLGISIHTFDQVSTWIAELKSQYPELLKSQDKLDLKVRKSPRIKQLKAPFLRSDDRKREYQPLYKELTSFPTIAFEEGPSTSPFCKPSPIPNKRTGGPSNKQCVSLTRDIQHAMDSSNSKKGFCELCEYPFNHRGQHVKSIKHRGNVTLENYKKLDKLIKNGETFSGFLRSTEKESETRKSASSVDERKLREGKSKEKKRVRITTRKTKRTVSKGKLRPTSSILKTQSSSTTFIPRKRKIVSASSNSKIKKRRSNVSKSDSSVSSLSTVRSHRINSTRKSKRKKHTVSRYVPGSSDFSFSSC